MHHPQTGLGSRFRGNWIHAGFNGRDKARRLAPGGVPNWFQVRNVWVSFAGMLFQPKLTPSRLALLCLGQQAVIGLQVGPARDGMPEVIA